MNGVATFALAVACAALSLPFGRPICQTGKDAVKYRQSAMFLQSTHFGRIAAMANGRVPYDKAAVNANAELVAMVSQLPWNWRLCAWHGRRQGEARNLERPSHVQGNERQADVRNRQASGGRKDR
jgi:cytochrome c556